MRKNEVINFLQLLMYYEVLPIHAEEADYNDIGKYCLRTDFVNATPDHNYIIAIKGLELLNGKVNWDDQILSLSTCTPVNDKNIKVGQVVAAAAAGGALVYELVAKAFFR